MKETQKPKRRRDESREGMRVTTIALTDEMHRQLAIEALDRRTVLTQLVREAISEWLERQGRKSKPSRRAK